MYVYVSLCVLCVSVEFVCAHRCMCMRVSLCVCACINVCMCVSVDACTQCSMVCF